MITSAPPVGVPIEKKQRLEQPERQVRRYRIIETNKSATLNPSRHKSKGGAYGHYIHRRLSVRCNPL